MKQWIQSWNLMRLLRLVMGIAIIFQGIDAKQWFIVALGVFFAVLPVLNIGCCGASSCRTSFKYKTSSQDKDITYTEIK